MTVKYFAFVREYAGRSIEDVPNQADVYALVRFLSEKHGERFRKAVLNLDGQELSDEIIVLVNGRNVVHLEGIRTALNDDDTVAIFPVVAGG